MRSAPAISANSPAAVPVPRSLCGCTDSTIASRRARWRCIHSIMSAKMFGVLCSTVDGRLTMHLRSRRRLPDLGDGIDHALGERELGAGEHLGRILEAPLGARLVRGAARGSGARAWSPVRRCRPRPARAPRVRITGAVALYRCTMTRLAPVQRLEGALDQFGRAPASAPGSSRRRASGLRSISRRTKSNSVCDADGKPTSISLKPISHQHLEHAQLARRVHRLDQRLVAVAQVDAAPQRRPGSARRRASVRSVEAHRREGAVLGLRLLQHGMSPRWIVFATRSLAKQNGPLRVANGP